MRGSVGSDAYGHTKISSGLLIVISSAMACPSMLLPVPGSPIRSTWRRCLAACWMMAQASSCPSTCAISASGTGISEVSTNSRTSLLLVPPGHEKTDHHPSHQHPKQNAHHPDLHGQRRMHGHHV